MVKDIKNTGENDCILFDETYTFVETRNYDDEVSKLPFDFWFSLS